MVESPRRIGTLPEKPRTANYTSGWRLKGKQTEHSPGQNKSMKKYSSDSVPRMCAKSCKVKPKCTKSKTQIYQKARKHFFFSTLTLNGSESTRDSQSWRTDSLWRWLISLQTEKLSGISVQVTEPGSVAVCLPEPVPPPGRLLRSAAQPSLMCIQIQTTYSCRQGNHSHLIFPLGYSLLSESL